MSLGAQLPKNIVIIGFMGCGKSTVGRKLSEMLGYPLVDTDDLIERKARMPITRIFAERGEDYFRQLEAAVLQELAAPGSPRRIISTGGGIVTRKGNRRQLSTLGYVVWLKVAPEEIMKRTARNNDRPLLRTEDPERKIRDMMEVRLPLYEQCADLALDTKGLDASEVACGILECARYHFASGA